MAPRSNKDSKRHRVRDTVQSGLDRLKHALKSSSSASIHPPVTTSSARPSPGSSNQASNPGEAPTNPNPTAPDNLTDAKHTAWARLETTLRMLEKSTGLFPPIKSAVSEIIGCLDVVEVAAENRKDYEELASEFKSMADTLAQYMNELGPEENSGSITRIAELINAQAVHINKQRERGNTKRILESTEDKDDVIKCYRRAEALFRQLQSDITLRALRKSNKQLTLELLRGMSLAEDAQYDSGYSTIIRRRGCTANTRQKIQEDLKTWVQDPGAPKVYWMDGMAGIGKTTLAYSLCSWLEGNKQLGASFFCSRNSSSCRDLNRVVPSIAYGLARYSPAFRSALCKILEDDPDASTRNVVRQFETLIQKPLQNVKDAIPEGVVIVIDALNECENSYGVRLMLEVLLRFAAELPVKFFVTSRPEPTIREKMLSPSEAPPSILHLHDVEQSAVEEDIKKYLAEAFNSMSPPPSADQIEQLAKRAGKLFVYAATVVRYVVPDNVYVDSNARLKTMLAIDSKSASKDGHRKKYKDLDALYSTILTEAFNVELLEDEELDVMKLVLRTAVCAKQPMTAQTFGLLLGLTEQQVSSVLQPLRSVLYVSENSELVSTLHASFPEYMFDQLRSDNFYCDEAGHNQLLAGGCFDVMKEQLRFNICNLESSFMSDRDVPDLEQRIRNNISPSLFYASRYWGDHLQSGNASDGLRDKLIDFLSHRLLFWVEVMNLKQRIGRAEEILLDAQNWLLVSIVGMSEIAHMLKLKQENGAPTDAQQLTADARNFVTHFASASSRSTPHLYISALPFCPKSNATRKCYWEHTQRLMDISGSAIDRRQTASLATWSTDLGVNSIAFSADGARIVFGCSDSSIRVCDAHTGNLVTGPFEGHTWPVNSVAFSPDGSLIVSGSDDKSIIVWDAHTGKVVNGPLQGHTDGVTSVKFSPDATCVASGSDDHTVRLWEVRTGDSVMEPLEGHKGPVNSVAFSPNGKLIASASADETVRFWDTHTGKRIPKFFKGRTGTIYSIAFSPDGTRIAFGCADSIVRVCEVKTATLIVESTPDHYGWIRSLAYSPQGDRLVSACDGGVIRIWDVRSYIMPVARFEGHSQGISSIAFSPDGTRIASGSWDCTIKVWDAPTSTVPEASEEYAGLVVPMVFSLDGSHILTGSDEDYLCVRDTHTGQVITQPFSAPVGSLRSMALSPDGTHVVCGSFDGEIAVKDTHVDDDSPTISFEGHTDSVNSIAFSLDAARIVSGSSDCTIRVWDVRSGNNIIGPLEGHTDSVDSVIFSPDGSRIASGSSDKTIRLWDANTGGLVIGPLEGHADVVEAVAFSHDGARIASGSQDHTIRVWDTQTGALIVASTEEIPNSVQSLTFSLDGARIISTVYHGIVIWDAHTAKILANPFEKRPERVRSFAVSSDGALVASSSGDYHAETYSIIRISNLNQQLDLDPDLESTLGGRWNCSEDGWVSSDGALLFWAPRELHESLPYPFTYDTMAIGFQGSVRINYQNLALGKKCPITPVSSIIIAFASTATRRVGTPDSKRYS
ncbi:hypothetical protein CTheo_4598 [Ceratobasidium theobromae]|uniref:Nephrocystin 3-like N-terminal domain-containing protein n=1 Tax=Ceratobasidium theobromae TaxID=1582974 RepID=A0A5N5QKK3_9AGAM|nr:hypothetical protein CTheo_4598 [Ceratobasidium theobromae]